MRVFPLTSEPPKPLVRFGRRSSHDQGAARHRLRVLATLPIVLLLLLGAAGSALAAGPAAIVATGLTEPSGVIVDPDGHAWVTDANGLCKVTDPTAAGPGTITATCVGGAGGAAFFDPTPLNPGSGDEVVLVGSGTANGTTVDRDQWDPATRAFVAGDTIDVGLARVQGVSIDDAGNAYVIAARDATVKRINDVTAASPTVDTVGQTAGVRGAGALAAGKDRNGATTIYLAENVGGGISALHPGTATTTASATALGLPGEAFGGLAYDAKTGVLYGGTANIVVPNQLIDTVEAFPVDPAGAQDNSFATGLGGVGGVAVKPDGTLLVVDDPSGNGNAGEGRMLATGVPAALILTGPSAATNDATPTFTFSVSGTAECKLAPVDAAFGACSSPFTPAAPLADGAYTFSVRSAGGFPVSRSFVVDTVAPTVAVDAPAEGATTSASPVFVFHTSEPAGASCRLDTAAFGPCGSPRGFSGLAAGGHTFDVRATDAAGNTGPIASVHFTVPAGAAGVPSPPGTPATPVGQIPGAGGVTGSGGVLGTVVDRTAPRLSLALGGHRLRLRGNAIALPFRCSETCAARITGTIAVKGSARLFRLGGATKLVDRGRTANLVVHVPRSALRSIRSALRAHRVVTLRLTLRAEDLAGNVRTSNSSVRLSR